MRRLKLEATLQPDMTTATLRVVEQTHFGEDFCKDAPGYKFKYTYKGLPVYLESSPEDTWDPDDPAEQPNYFFTYEASPNRLDIDSYILLYVNGEHRDDINYAVPFPATFWPYIKAAVEEYNRVGALED